MRAQSGGCPSAESLLRRLRGEGFGKAFAEAYPEPCGKASPNQDQDQEQEQDLLRTLFEAFWEAYPRKEDRQAAWTQWQLMRPDAPFAAQIVAGVRRHLNTRAWRENLKKGNVQFIPLPSTFLSKGRWLDDVREEPAVKDDFPDWTACAIIAPVRPAAASGGL